MSLIQYIKFENILCWYGTFSASNNNNLYVPTPGLDNALRVFGVHKDVAMNMELSQGGRGTCVCMLTTIKKLFYSVGSLLKRSKVRGVKVETLKLPAATDFAAGQYIHWEIISSMLSFPVCGMSYAYS